MVVSIAVHHGPTSCGSVDLSVFLRIVIQHGPTSNGSVDLSAFLSIAVHRGCNSHESVDFSCSYQLVYIMPYFTWICWTVCGLINCCTSGPYFMWIC